MTAPAKTSDADADAVDERNNDRGGASKKQARLSINLNQEAADFLDVVTKRRDISYTEAVRRALALYKLLEDQTAQGNHVQIDDGKKIRDLVVI